MNAAEEAAIARAMGLSVWKDPQAPALLGGGITNLNVVLSDQGKRYVVRVGADKPLHQIMRFNEYAAHCAAVEVGIAPPVVHFEPGLLAIEFVESETLTEATMREQRNLERAVAVVAKCHREAARHVRGPVLAFWVFHVIRDYAATLRADSSPHVTRVADFLRFSDRLEKAVGPVQMVLGHNDLLAANFLDDGKKLWLIDWEYAGLNSPLFDLAGLSTNNGLTLAQECSLLEHYFDTELTEQLLYRFTAMKCASLLREAMWSMVSELHSEIDFDYSSYTAENLARFEAVMTEFQSL